MAERLTRQQLYDLVWSEPLRTLALRLKISDVALKKHCARERIPAPERGYWNKRQAGKKTNQVALPPRPPGMNDEILIGGDRHSWWRDTPTNEEILGPIPPRPTFEEPIETVRDRARKDIGKVSVSKTFTPAHPVIERHLNEDEKRKEKQRASTYTFSWEAPIFDAPFERRRLRVLNAIFVATARAGAKCWTRGREAREIGITVGRQHVYLKLDAVTRQQRKSPELKNNPDWLKVAILNGYGTDSERISWSDDEAEKIEDKLAAIATEIFVAAENQYRESCIYQYEWRAERRAQLIEEENKKKLEAERLERERKIKAEKDRIDRLLNEANLFRQAKDIRDYVSSVRIACQSSDIPLEALDQWCAWALGEAERIDPVASRSFLNDLPKTGET
jgi:hypothetical protein